MLLMDTVADLKKREALQAYLSIGTLLGTTGKGDMSPLAPRRAVVSFSTIKVPAMLNASVSPIQSTYAQSAAKDEFYNNTRDT